MRQIIRNKVIYLRYLILLVFLVLVSGCSVYKGSFDCKPKKGVGCEPVSKVNELINDDRLDEFTENLEVKKKCGCNKGEATAVKNDVVDKHQSVDSEKITIHFNEYQDRGVIYKKSEVEVGVK
jgi:hypothetical protein